MINRTEIEQKAKEFEIHQANVERDYIFGWILFGIFTVSELKDVIFLKGGNALRKGYFANTRFSNDLDFGIPGNIQSGVLLNEINRVCDFIHTKNGVSFVNENNKVEEKFIATEGGVISDLKVYEAKIYFKDFYGNSDHIIIKISMDITRFDKVLLPLQTVDLIHPYSDASEVTCQIRCMKLEEIIATKLKCLLQRQHAPDLFDYVYSVKLLGGNLNKDEVVRTFVQKTIFGRNPHVVKQILQKTPFDYFKDCWNKTVICAKQFIIGVEEAIATFLTELDTIFGIFPDSQYVQFVYFSSELRAPIIKAGREQTLLKMRYNGSDRIVEPYSLKYMLRKDGNQREYFYGYNCTGGSGTGIRCFVAENVQSIENTEEKFTPRFLIELCKAGERPQNPFLFDPNRPARPPKKRSVFSSSRKFSGPKYVYQCNYCGKRFTKSINNGTLNAHKDKNGYPCSSRHGYYITTKY